MTVRASIECESKSRAKLTRRKARGLPANATTTGKEGVNIDVVKLWGADDDVGDGDDDDDAGCSGVREDGAIEENVHGTTTIKTTRLTATRYDSTTIESFDFYDDLFNDAWNEQGRGEEENGDAANLQRNDVAFKSPKVVVEVRYCTSCRHDLPVATHFIPRRKTCVSCLGYHKRYARRKRRVEKRRRKEEEDATKDALAARS
jgi:hypothetical protein